MNEQDQLKILWKVIDQLHTAAQDVQQGYLTNVSLAAYVERKTAEAMVMIPYPGEPPEAVWEAETRTDEHQ